MGHQENSGVAPKPPSILPDPSHLEQFGQRTDARRAGREREGMMSL